MHTASYEFLIKPKESAGCHLTLSVRVKSGDETRSGDETTIRDAGMEWNGTRNVVQYGRGSRIRGQKFALIKTARFCVRTLISHSVTATKTGQAQTESHVKRIKLLR